MFPFSNGQAAIFAGEMKIRKYSQFVIIAYGKQEKSEN
jgi:hypothetical protein